jgi:hypothetical protein
VAGVAIGDTYTATLNHDLSQTPLHVPLTSTARHNFGTGEVQVNPLVSRMVDSSLNNVGTYGVRFDVDLNLNGAGEYALVLSHPTPNGRNFTAFRGSIGIETEEGYREVHVGMGSGQSLPLTELSLKPNQVNKVRVSLVYPADATPGHLLSVVPNQQLAMAQQRWRQLQQAQAKPVASPLVAVAAPPPNTDTATVRRASVPAVRPIASAPTQPAITPPAGWWQALPAIPSPPRLPAAVINPARMSESLVQRYQQAVEAQKRLMNALMGR